MFKGAFFGDSGDALNDGTSFYYSPGQYEGRLGSGGPIQEAVARMMRGWEVSDLINLGDASYSANSSTLLDYNIGKYYNDYMAPYGDYPDLFLYSNPSSIYSVNSQGGVQAEPGKRQWPYNFYNFPYGFPNPVTGGQGGSIDGLNHFWLTPGNHDVGTILANYNDTNVNDVDSGKVYIGKPIGPDAFDYKNNISTRSDLKPGTQITSKVGSIQQLLDYLPFLKGQDNTSLPYIRPGQISIGRANADGYGLWYSVNLGAKDNSQQSDPLLHVVFLDTSRIMTDAGYYAFNFNSAPASGGDFRFDPTNSKAANANFQPPNTAPTDPSVSTQMFEWVKADLRASKAQWNIVVGHHPGYHVGNTTDLGNKSYFNNPVVIKFLAGLKDEVTGRPLLDAYFNGHSHGYSRVLEMTSSLDGIGLGIPCITTGNSGTSVLNTINQAPYGSSVLKPENFLNTFTETTANGEKIAKENTSLFFPKDDYLDYLKQLPADANPTSVGLSALYGYSNNNLPNNSELVPGQNPSKVKVGSLQGGDSFVLTNTVYNTLLAGSEAATGDVSGIYGYGSGASYVEVDNDYFFTNYQTAHTLDPAVTLIGKQQGLTDNQMARGTQFYSRWSPKSSALQDLALFSFKVFFNADKTDAYLGDLQLVQKGNGYMEIAKGSGAYIDGTYTFEIMGNNPLNPLGFADSDPTRAAVDLTFSQGQLVKVAFAKDSQGRDRVGSGYQQLANAANKNNYDENKVTKDQLPLLVGININLEAQTFLADQSPGDSLYQDWYLVADTTINSLTTTQGSYGGLRLSISPSSARAREILATQPLTTGYSGIGQQASYPDPQQGLLSVTDAYGNVVAGSTVSATSLAGGSANLMLKNLPAPGFLKVDFGGDATSSYQVNFKASSSNINLSYGDWKSSLSGTGSLSLSLSGDTPLTVSRSDAQLGSVSFGLRKSDSTIPIWLLLDATAQSSWALDTARVFTASGTNGWLNTEGQRLGSSQASATSVSAGNWSPVATDSLGHEIAVESIDVANNTASVTFSGGVKARYSVESSGVLASTGPAVPIVVSIKRLGSQSNGLAFYVADSITGAITYNGQTVLPGQLDYLRGALELARRDNLLLGPGQLPGYGEEVTLAGLPLLSSQNYGLLLLRNNDPDDLSCSYSQANPGNVVTVQSFLAPGRGVIYGMEDLRPNATNFDFDCNDLIVTMSGSAHHLI